MDARLEIASRLIAGQWANPDITITSDALAATDALHAADALIAAHEATAKPAEADALPEDAPVMEWRVWVEEANGYCWAVSACTLAEVDRAEMFAPMRRRKADAAADIPAVRAAATAYSAAKGYRAVFTGEGAGDDR